MADEQFKRNIAFKIRVGDILLGKPVMKDNRFGSIELGDKSIVRVNIVGNIVEKYESTTETKFLSITIDDGSGQIKLKAFGDDVEKFKDFNQGETVLVIGTLRNWNNETYINPEIIRDQEPRYLLVRKLETEKEKNKNAPLMKKDEIIAIKDRIIEKIRGAEETGGIEKDKIILEVSEVSPNIINQELQKLLEEGIIFEPRPGKVRYLG